MWFHTPEDFNDSLYKRRPARLCVCPGVYLLEKDELHKAMVEAQFLDERKRSIILFLLRHGCCMVGKFGYVWLANLNVPVNAPPFVQLAVNRYKGRSMRHRHQYIQYNLMRNTGMNCGVCTLSIRYHLRNNCPTCKWASQRPRRKVNTRNDALYVGLSNDDDVTKSDKEWDPTLYDYAEGQPQRKKKKTQKKEPLATPVPIEGLSLELHDYDVIKRLYEVEKKARGPEPLGTVRNLSDIESLYFDCASRKYHNSISDDGNWLTSPPKIWATRKKEFMSDRKQIFKLWHAERCSCLPTPSIFLAK